MFFDVAQARDRVQALRMWARGPALGNAPMDFLALCQIAYTQQHRQDLFRCNSENEREDP